MPLCLFACFCVPAAAGIFPSRPFSDDAAGTVSAVFLKTPPSARFQALAGAGLALHTPDAFFFNPAGTAYLPPGRSALLLGYESLLESSGRSSLAFLKGFDGGVLGLGLLYKYEAGLERYDALGAARGSFQAYDAALIASCARRFGALDLGLAVKALRSRLDGEAANSAALDAGAVFRGTGAGAATDFSLTARNLGFPMKLGSSADPLPFELAGAMHWRYAPELSILAEGRLPVDHSPYVVLAGEYGLALGGSAGLSLRAGLNFRNYNELGMMSALASGFGVRFGASELDYAFVPYGDLGATHRLTFGRGFGAASAAPRARPSAVEQPAAVIEQKSVEQSAAPVIEQKPVETAPVAEPEAEPKPVEPQPVFEPKPAEQSALVVEQEPATELKVIGIKIGKSISARQPRETAEVFDLKVGRIYCWTAVKASPAPVMIKHVWYADEKKVITVKLPVKPLADSSWRTWSTTRVYWGKWKVEVTDENGNVLDSITFRVGKP